MVQTRKDDKIFYIEKVENDKTRYLDFLLLEDPSENYLPGGEMFVLFENNKVIGQCVVIERCKEECELKNHFDKRAIPEKGAWKKADRIYLQLL